MGLGESTSDRTPRSRDVAMDLEVLDRLLSVDQERSLFAFAAKLGNRFDYTGDLAVLDEAGYCDITGKA